MEKQYIELFDLYKVKGIGKKTIQRIKKTLLHNKKDESKEIIYPTKFILPLNNFYISESVLWMQKNMPSNYVDLTVTSPPYDNLRTYKGYNFDYKTMLKELYRVTKVGGIVVWVVGDVTINGSETGTSFRQALYAIEVGFNLHDTMIYEKTSQYPANVRYQQDFEYMFVFSKGKPNTFNPIYTLKTIKEIKKIIKGSFKHRESTYRNINGITEKLDDNALKRLEKSNKIPIKTMSNIWKCNAGYMISTSDKIAFNHPATFPEQLAQDHIISWSNESDIIFDPMVGSGTTAKMAWLNNRKFIGVDCSEEYINDICIPRLKKYGWDCGD